MSSPTNLSDILTPFALIDLPILEQNISDFANKASLRGISVRPHVKTHKSTEIAKMQIEQYGSGVCVATLHEAKVMAQAGITDIFMAYPVVGRPALDQYRELQQFVNMCSAADSIFHLDQLLSELPHHHLPSHIRIEVDCGQHRCGCAPTAHALRPLAEKILNHPDHFILDGVFTHAGHSYLCTESDKRRQIAEIEAKSVIEAAQILRNMGLDCPIISTGSTPTAEFALIDGVNEIRPGNYCFNDAVQIALGSAHQADCAFKVVARVIGVYPDRIVIDAGSKSLGLDKGAHGTSAVKGHGTIIGYEHLEIASLSEEHGIIPIKSSVAGILQPGQLIEIIPNHACAAANLFSSFHLRKSLQIIGTYRPDARR